MYSKLAKEKHAESMMGLSDKFFVVGSIYPFTYFLRPENLSVTEQWVVLIAPVVLVIAGIIIRVVAMRSFDEIDYMNKD